MFLIPFQDFNMRLTAQMVLEFNGITHRLQNICLEKFSNLPRSFDVVQELYQEELNAHKVKLEGLLTDTDIKEMLKL